MANEIGLAGLQKAKALRLVSLGESAVAPPSERKGIDGGKRWAAEKTKVRRGFLRKEDEGGHVTPIRVDLCCLFKPLWRKPRER